MQTNPTINPPTHHSARKCSYFFESVF